MFTISAFCVFFSLAVSTFAKTCTISPLGPGKDDTDHVMSAITSCGQNGNTVIQAGNYNITKKMTWNLANSQVDLFGTLSFNPDITYWLNASNTYRVIFIQSQASWFVLSGKNFTVNAHNTGGINGNGQPWWNFYTSHTRRDGDGRPVALTVFNATSATVKNFKIQSPPFWCNAVANSVDVTYDGMLCNATNANPAFFGKNILVNTDGIDTYRSDRINLLNWDVTGGDDCMAFKGNSSNIVARNVTCRGGLGIAFGSLGQYAQLNDLVENVLVEDLTVTRINSSIQPLALQGVYFKTWSGTVHGSPPTGGGGGGGLVNNVTIRSVTLDRVDKPVNLYQNNNGKTGDAPSKLRFSNLNFADWTGVATTNTIVDLACSSAAPCQNIAFTNFKIAPPAGQASSFICVNVVNEKGLSGPCNATGHS
ncbi:pectin lyase-like protein [Rickenella mellea]|uniref:galacturonan 1,4-alpha-galacturonidase n=1 Tax=Rickenella mellea TaxID=50990 RepID=A0A4Y7PQE8_9AGAM|nr:pectin lyase-like protein [Rickenella mellea]